MSDAPSGLPLVQTSWLPGEMPNYIAYGHQAHATITPEECERIGGHCFERTDSVLLSTRPQYPEECKHCGKRRVGVPQAAMRYYDPDEPLVPREPPAEGAGC